MIAMIKLIASLFTFVSPIMLDWIITYMNPNNSEPVWRGYLYASLMYVSPMMESMLTSQYEYHINIVSMRMRASLTSAVYDKCIRLHSSAKQEYTVGEIVNLIAIDTQRIVDFVNNVLVGLSAPVQIALGVYLLWLQLASASMAGFAYMIVIVPINIWITKLISSMQLRCMREKDKRAKLMNEVLTAIKVIKLNNWETFFENKLMHYRHLEMVELKKYSIYLAFMVTFFSSGAFFVS